MQIHFLQETTMKRFVLKTLVAAAALAAFGVASAQAIGEHTLKFTTQNPKGHPLVMGMEKFAEIVTAKSGGKIKVNLFPGGVLGGDGPVLSAMQGGTIEMASMNSSSKSSRYLTFHSCSARPSRPMPWWTARSASKCTPSWTPRAWWV